MHIMVRYTGLGWAGACARVVTLQPYSTVKWEADSRAPHPEGLSQWTTYLVMTRMIQVDIPPYHTKRNTEGGDPVFT